MEPVIRRVEIGARSMVAIIATRISYQGLEHIPASAPTATNQMRRARCLLKAERAATSAEDC
jgi:hypothetical protein